MTPCKYPSIIVSSMAVLPPPLFLKESENVVELIQ